MTPAAVLSTALAAGGLIHGQNGKETAQALRVASGLLASNDIDAAIFNTNSEAQAVFDSFLDFTLQVQFSRFRITKNDLSAWSNGQPGILNDYTKAIKGLTKAHIEHMQKQALGVKN